MCDTTNIIHFTLYKNITNLNGLCGRAEALAAVGVAERPVCFVLLAIFHLVFVFVISNQQLFEVQTIMMNIIFAFKLNNKWNFS